MSHKDQLEFKSFSVETPHMWREPVYSYSIDSTLTKICGGYRQKVVTRSNNKVIGELLYLPSYRFLMLPADRKNWHYRLSESGVWRLHHRYINNLSRRMMSTADRPDLRRPVSKWRKRYEQYLRPYIRFKKPEKTKYVLVEMEISAVYTGGSYLIKYVFDPLTDNFKRLSINPKANFKDMGLRNFQVDSINMRSKQFAIATWKQYLTRDLPFCPAE